MIVIFILFFRSALRYERSNDYAVPM